MEEEKSAFWEIDGVSIKFQVVEKISQVALLQKREFGS